ncbi:MAG TPA: glucose 1-dehydrogenase [Thermoleophilaceae bacterium]|jgi:NAD(P)-dependent dehydrogenase (short-subunit alcohol dehydrogenase family)
MAGLGGSVVLITGAGRGLGRAFSLAFADAGGRVAAADIDEAAAAETAELVRSHGVDAVSVPVDVSDAASVAAMVDSVRSGLGGIDVLVNNAGLYAGLRRAPFHEIEEAEWDRAMSVNLKGPWLCAKACLPVMRERGGGAIVNVASATVFSGSPEWAHYVASKGGLIALTRAMAREAGDLGIRVNALAPGFTLTDASREIIPDAETYGVARGSIKRSAQPEDIVGSAVFLASPASGFITGQTLIVDGGRQFL